MHTNETNLFFILIAMLGIFGLFSAYFVYLMSRHYRYALRLQAELDTEKIRLQDQERKSFAADLHDDIAPILSACIHKLSSGPLITDREREVADHLDQVFSRIREISLMLVAPSLQLHGPLYALEEFCEHYIKDMQMKIEVEPVKMTSLSPDHAHHLYRMLLEILHNAVRHSRATSLKFRGTISKDEMMIVTEDNGIGFHYNSMAKVGGIGLNNLSSRAALIGASLYTDTAPGKGTSYVIRIPLQKNLTS